MLFPRFSQKREAIFNYILEVLDVSLRTQIVIALLCRRELVLDLVVTTGDGL